MSINNKNLNTESNKIRKASMLIMYVHDKIISNQNIRRMMYYNTKNPLSKIGLTYNGKEIAQPDVEEDQVKDIITDLPFSPGIGDSLQNNIYINLPKGVFSDKNELYIDINVLVPIEFTKISNGKREYEISQEIANELDEIYVEGEYQKELGGGLKLKYINSYTERLSKVNSFTWVCNKYKCEQTPLDRIKV